MNEPASFRLDHVERLCDERGMFEHADGTTPRLEHGYCTDDNTRLLVVTTREPDTGVAKDLNRLALRFVLAAQDPDGRTRNRMDTQGRWTDEGTVEDCWGRSLWALGSTAAHHADDDVCAQARRAFDGGARRRSPWSRSMAFAALGAADVIAVDPADASARALLHDALAVIAPLGLRPLAPSAMAHRPTGARAGWRWPERRLTYANATLAEAVIAAGSALERPADLERGLAMLSWLLDLETRDGHLSVAGAAGRGPGVRGPQFDQQPIEVSAMADACMRAYEVTNDGAWLRGIHLAAAWFAGKNDVGLVMHDPVSGGGYDGLHRERVNLNQGAESTLAMLSTVQRARRLVLAR